MKVEVVNQHGNYERNPFILGKSSACLNSLISKQQWEKKGSPQTEGETAKGVSAELPLLFTDPHHLSRKEVHQGKVRLRLRLVVPPSGPAKHDIDDNDIIIC